MNGMGKNVMFWLGIGLLLMFLFNVFQGAQMPGGKKAQTVAYSDFMADAKAGRITDVTIKGQDITGHLSSSGEEFPHHGADGRKRGGTSGRFGRAHYGRAA
jgi:cell division protease FtsH